LVIIALNVKFVNIFLRGPRKAFSGLSQGTYLFLAQLVVDTFEKKEIGGFHVKMAPIWRQEDFFFATRFWQIAKSE